jgi:hypothetical protein
MIWMPLRAFEDERLHLGVPTTGLVSEMDTRFEQFFDTNGGHVSLCFQ